MSLPHDQDIQVAILRLLASAPKGTMHCQDVYRILAQEFPELTYEELWEPYRRSVSHRANRVQFARWRLIEKGFLLRYTGRGRGFWSISDAGRAWLANQQARAEELLRELDLFSLETGACRSEQIGHKEGA